MSTPAIRNANTTPKSASKSTPAREKTSRGGNASILSFFKKAEPKPEQENDSLFLSGDEDEERPSLSKSRGDTIKIDVDEPEKRYNESTTSLKRRRTATAESAPRGSNTSDSMTAAAKAPALALQEIPFSTSPETKLEGSQRRSVVEHKDPEDTRQGKQNGDDAGDEAFVPPVLQHESTSMFDDGFEGIEDFADEEFPAEGEEYLERRWMEEQRLLEAEFEQDDDLPDMASGEQEHANPVSEESSTPASICPICGTSLASLDADRISVHVNDCLDGKNPPPPAQVTPQEANGTDNDTKEPSPPQPQLPYKRFQRAAIARPGQENPFTLDETVAGGSAFSKLMASHAEDTAWATAAANEVAARGKPAYKRTCPFYKILPGFFTCVDAFRYGAVEGCNAYFLSHFHSDHYIGLTSSWCHGPIYCSRVTGNLVRQQLRVDPKWVVDLEWDKKIEVPRTQGMHVTMIPANHCPGSSLFLFEKAVGRGPQPKLQRVLHCGDFRACPAHVQHPLLRPELVDLATGKKRQQKLDVCYLDTTYLTPKYAFPRQAEVVQACADLCVSLSKDKVDASDKWEQTKKQRAGGAMSHFIQKTPSHGDATGDATHPTSPATKSRGRLLVIVGTYSIGKERICLGVAKALNSKIFAAPGKQRICAALEDPELAALLTTDPLEAQVHMQMLMEIRAETLADYLTGYKPHFSRIVGFRPSGWNYRPPNSRFVESPLVQTVLHSDNWKPSYSMAELVPQRGSSREASCFGVPYSEHSSFRELTMFCCALHIDKIIPTVNVGSAKSREKMKGWIDKWAADKRKHGLYRVPDDLETW